MRKLITLLLVCGCIHTQAQSNLTNNIIEGGKTLVDLIKVIKAPKANTIAGYSGTISRTDSCVTKGLVDIAYKNNSGKSMFVSLYLRNGNALAAIPLTLKVLNGGKENLFEIQAGIYKYKIEYEEEEKRVVYKEGEIKLQACDKKELEIK